MTTIAQIGVGRWGTNIKNTLAAIGSVELLTAETPAEARSLAERDDLDAAIIATPGSTHADIALPFIKRGLPTFIEKPLTTSPADAKKLDRAAIKSGALIFVGHIHLYNPAYQKLKTLVQGWSKNLPRAATGVRALHFEGMNNGPFRDDMSALWDWAPHDVAMALDLLGTEPVSVQAWGLETLRPKKTSAKTNRRTVAGSQLFDTVFTKLLFPSASGRNIPVTITNSWLSPEKRKKLIVVGTKNSIVLDDVQPSHPTSTGTTASGKLTLYKNMGPDVHGGKVTHRDPTISHPPYGSMSPLEVELRAFLRMVRTKSRPTTDSVHGIAVVNIIAAAEQSAQLDGKLITF